MRWAAGPAKKRFKRLGFTQRQIHGEEKKTKTGQCTKRISESRAQQRGKKLFNCEKQQQDCSGTREALLSEAGFEKVFRPRIGPVGGSCFVDDFVSCWGKRDAYRLLLEPS